MKRLKEGSSMLVLVGVILLAVVGVMIYNSKGKLLPFKQPAEVILSKPFTQSDQALSNPLMGFAQRADEPVLNSDVTLVYIDVYWSQLEPQEGVYDWEAIESSRQFQRWKSEGKHAVFRFILDYPQDDAHRDIPQWLYDRTADGVDYDHSYGKGYSPNYSNPDFISAYEKTVVAMGQRWGQDDFIAYLQLGVMGHWGEWHTKLPDGTPGAMPDEAVRDQYVEPWLTAFPHTEVMMRRPFNIAKEEGLGLFNDVFADDYETDRWLNWIDEGGSYSQTGEADALSAMKDYWKTAPSGGEIASNVEMSDVLDKKLDKTISMLKASHTTFLGPKMAKQEVSPEGYDEMRKHMGYRLWVSSAEELDNNKVIITWENSGVAPFYRDWPVKVYVETTEGTEVLSPKFDIRKVLPGERQELTFTLDKKLAKTWTQISVGIQDPRTGQDAVHLAIKGLEDYTRVPVLKNKSEEDSSDKGQE